MAYIVTVSIAVDEPDPDDARDFVMDLMDAAISDPIIDWSIDSQRLIPEPVKDSVCNETYSDGDAFEKSHPEAMGIRGYDHEEFLGQPGKYRKYRRAVLAKAFDNNWKVGEVLAIEYMTERPARPGEEPMPIYRVRNIVDPPGTPRSTCLFAQVLGNFSE